LSEGEGLTSVFNGTYSRLQELKSSVDGEVITAVNEINSLTRSIADLNKNIITARGGDPNFPANDLLDQRNNLINKLAEKVSVSTVVQDDGAINVFIGKGQGLVVGATSQQLTTAASAFDVTQLEVGVAIGGTSVNITGQLSGGSLGGALSFRKDVLDKANNQLGRVALAISEDMNAQHKLGFDLNNQLGGNFFSDLTVTSSQSNSNNAVATDHIYTATVSDSSLLQASNYRLDYGVGNVYSLTRLSDNSVVGSSASLATLSGTVSTSEGFTLALGSGSSIAVGDSFLISPVANAARDIDMSLTHTNQIAAASPLLASRNSANSGDAIFTNDNLLTSTGSLPASAITFTFNSATNEFVASPAASTTPPSAVLSYDPATNNGSQYQVTLAGVGDYQFTISGNPANGDQIDVNVNNNGSGDNRNILAMIGLQEQKLVGNANYQEAYSQLVSEVGVKTKRAEFSMDANQLLYDRAVSSQQEVSGVNLDEEAADLIRFQQAYQAVARVISTADELFQSLLGAV
jgi:flagellar hook-associated protein 1 FlgK